MASRCCSRNPSCQVMGFIPYGQPLPGAASLPGQGLAVSFPGVHRLGLCSLPLSTQPKRCQGQVIWHKSAWLHSCQSKATHAPQLGSRLHPHGQGTVCKCSEKSAKAEFSPSLQHRLFFCIFKAFLTMLLGLDLCRVIAGPAAVGKILMKPRMEGQAATPPAMAAEGKCGPAV